MSHTSESQWLTVEQAAALAGITAESIRRRIRSGTLPASRASGGARAPWLVHADAVGKYAADLAARHDILSKFAANHPTAAGLHVLLVVDRTLVEDMPADALRELLGQMAYSKIQKMVSSPTDIHVR